MMNEKVTYSLGDRIVDINQQTKNDSTAVLPSANANNNGHVNDHSATSSEMEAIRADFYAKVTHDLRSPTGAIMTCIELLTDEEYGYGSLTTEQCELLDISRRMADKLLHLINGYLDFAKIEAGYLRLNKDEVELRGLVESSTYLFSFQCAKKEQTLKIDLPDEPVTAVADAERLQQVLDNLISNAVKYTSAGGQITVRLYREGEEAVISVKDTGPGIPAKDLPALFTKYHRVPGTTTHNIQGFGLGLFIVKEIVEAHHGLVLAESDGIPGHGSTFTVRIPLKAEELNVKHEKSDSPP